ncbi:hypothetical protein DEU56DRAFT_786586 [Suillus clintonianus]|uniref:uncharacterized protein n=1 Tax=Suillus clintonianus TaxID=1904413 RepID=UPI001B87EE5B|nr:uncharacterized protein DEU56DRAFT_786586 [Suillus clintonianus]KAG2146812.1 hypothetical protein DEU56DRAFT_786586 [Suillus clintonianus]
MADPSGSLLLHCPGPHLHFRVCRTLVIIASPSLSFVVSIICLMAGETLGSSAQPTDRLCALALMIAGMTSGVWFIRLIVYLEVVCWIWVPFVFLWCAVPEEFWDTHLMKVGDIAHSLMRVPRPWRKRQGSMPLGR